MRSFEYPRNALPAGEQSLVLEAENKETVDVYCENCGFKERAKG